jgi:hypothetical protein
MASKLAGLFLPSGRSATAAITCTTRFSCPRASRSERFRNDLVAVRPRSRGHRSKPVQFPRRDGCRERRHSRRARRAAPRPSTSPEPTPQSRSTFFTIARQKHTDLLEHDRELAPVGYVQVKPERSSGCSSRHRGHPPDQIRPAFRACRLAGGHRRKLAQLLELAFFCALVSPFVRRVPKYTRHFPFSSMVPSLLTTSSCGPSVLSRACKSSAQFGCTAILEIRDVGYDWLLDAAGQWAGRGLGRHDGGNPSTFLCNSDHRRSTTASASQASTSIDLRSLHELRTITRVKPSGPVRRIVACSKSRRTSASRHTLENTYGPAVLLFRMTEHDVSVDIARNSSNWVTRLCLRR